MEWVLNLKANVALLQGSEMSAGFHYRGLILGIQCFRVINDTHMEELVLY